METGMTTGCVTRSTEPGSRHSVIESFIRTLSWAERNKYDRARIEDDAAKGDTASSDTELALIALERSRRTVGAAGYMSQYNLGILCGLLHKDSKTIEELAAARAETLKNGNREANVS